MHFTPIVTYQLCFYRYTIIHQKLFGKCDGELMPRPSKMVLYKICGIYSDFLKRNNLESLTPFSTVILTMVVYGYLDELPVLYGLIWNTPNLKEGFLRPKTCK